MNITPIVTRLRHGAAVFEALARDVPMEQARWRPAADQWSILEVVCHLADEEVRDFRIRLDVTVHRPDEPWPPNDPEGLVVEERYNERDLAPQLEVFVAERARSVAFLEALNDPDWTRAREHPHYGTVTAGDLLSSWVAHDLIHVRQINRLHRQWLEQKAAPEWSPLYAGRW